MQKQTPWQKGQIQLLSRQHSMKFASYCVLRQKEQNYLLQMKSSSSSAAEALAFPFTFRSWCLCRLSFTRWLSEALFEMSTTSNQSLMRLTVVDLDVSDSVGGRHGVAHLIRVVVALSKEVLVFDLLAVMTEPEPLRCQLDIVCHRLPLHRGLANGRAFAYL